jgi:hypothetical protein
MATQPAPMGSCDRETSSRGGCFDRALTYPSLRSFADEHRSIDGNGDAHVALRSPRSHDLLLRPRPLRSAVALAATFTVWYMSEKTVSIHSVVLYLTKTKKDRIVLAPTGDDAAALTV